MKALGDIAAPVLVFGGPYSNLRAVEAMRAQADKLGIDAAHTICTGDVVAYCAEPEETVRAIRAWGCHVVAGNCEEQLAQDADDCGCGFAADTACDRLAKDWYSYARTRISTDSRAWMGALPGDLSFSTRGVRFRVLHGGVSRINRFVFGSDREALHEEFAQTDADVVIGGHAGIPFVAEVENRVWFNPGVIGMPANDGTTDVWFGLIGGDADGVVLTTHRLPYDHEDAAARLRRAAFADPYAAALTSGLWPSLDILPARERQKTGMALAEIRWRVAPRTTSAATVVA